MKINNELWAVTLDRRDLVIAHYEDRQYVLTGKAMVACTKRGIAINLYRAILKMAAGMNTAGRILCRGRPLFLWKIVEKSGIL